MTLEARRRRPVLSDGQFNEPTHGRLDCEPRCALAGPFFVPALPARAGPLWPKCHTGNAFSQDRNAPIGPALIGRNRLRLSLQRWVVS